MNLSIAQLLEVPPRETTSNLSTSLYHNAASGLSEVGDAVSPPHMVPVQPSLQELVAVQSQVRL